MEDKTNLTKLVDWLVCPSTGSKLILSDDKTFLISLVAKLKYPIREGIPILFIEEAVMIEEDNIKAEMEKVKK